MKRQRTPLYRFLAPRYWTMWLGLGVVRLAVLLPFRAQLALGRGLGRILFHALAARRRVGVRNLEICFPELDEEARRRLLHAHFEALGIAVFEIGLCWWAPAWRLRPLVRIEGKEHLDRALAAGRGAILLSGHFTTLEIGGRLLGLFTPFHLMYRPHANPLYEEILRRRREHHFEKAIPRDSVRDMLRSLRDGYAVWYAPDQAWDRRAGALVPFFGELAHTNTATSRLAATSRAPVLPFYQERLADGSGYRLVVEPPLDDFPGDSPEADAARINRILEAQIRRIPEQYLWVHRRFKRRPPDLPDLYSES